MGIGLTGYVAGGLLLFHPNLKTLLLIVKN